jgi:GGDEF domain-containing protein
MSPAPAPPHPRPVAEAPVAALVAEAPELAKRWLIALIASRPLPGAQRLAIDDLVRQAPALCAEVVRALGSDLACERLVPGGDLAPLAARAGSMAGADEPGAAVAAMEALRSVLWSALMSELRDPTPALVSDLAGRLAHVCALVTSASVSTLSHAYRRPGVQPPDPLAVSGASTASDPNPARSAPGASVLASAALAHSAPVGPASPGPAPRGPAPPGSGPLAADGAPGGADTASGAADGAPGGADRAPAGADEAPSPADAGSPDAAAVPPAAASGGAAPAEPVPAGSNDPHSAARGMREAAVTGEGPASWIGSIGRRLERFKEDGLPFAVLLIELADVDRLRRAERPHDLAEMVSQVERAVSSLLRPADLLTRESIGRYWLVTPETDAEGAHALAERVASAVQADASHRGAPLQVAIGTAVCPDDGAEAASLAARADIAMFGARASGRPVAAMDEQV